MPDVKEKIDKQAEELTQNGASGQPSLFELYDNDPMTLLRLIKARPPKTQTKVLTCQNTKGKTLITLSIQVFNKILKGPLLSRYNDAVHGKGYEDTLPWLETLKTLTEINLDTIGEACLTVNYQQHAHDDVDKKYHLDETYLELIQTRPETEQVPLLSDALTRLLRFSDKRFWRIDLFLSHIETLTEPNKQAVLKTCTEADKHHYQNTVNVQSQWQPMDFLGETKATTLQALNRFSLCPENVRANLLAVAFCNRQTQNAGVMSACFEAFSKLSFESQKKVITANYHYKNADGNYHFGPVLFKNLANKLSAADFETFLKTFQTSEALITEKPSRMVGMLNELFCDLEAGDEKFRALFHLLSTCFPAKERVELLTQVKRLPYNDKAFLLFLSSLGATPLTQSMRSSLTQHADKNLYVKAFKTLSESEQQNIQMLLRSKQGALYEYMSLTDNVSTSLSCLPSLSFWRTRPPNEALQAMLEHGAETEPLLTTNTSKKAFI